LKGTGGTDFNTAEIQIDHNCFGHHCYTAMKSSYNERFSFNDPTSPWSACRSTRTRAAKKVKSVQTAHESIQQTSPAKVLDGDAQIEDTMDLAICSHTGTELPAVSNMNFTNVESSLGGTDQFAQVIAGGLEVNQTLDQDETGDDAFSNHPQSLEYELVTSAETLSGLEDEDEEEEADPTEDYNSDNISLCQNEQQLYKDAPISTACSKVVLMKFAMKHRLTQEAITDLLQVLRLHLPESNNVPFTILEKSSEVFSTQLPFITFVVNA